MTFVETVGVAMAATYVLSMLASVVPALARVCFRCVVVSSAGQVRQIDAFIMRANRGDVAWTTRLRRVVHDTRTK